MFRKTIQNAIFPKFSFQKIMLSVGREQDCTHGGATIEWLEEHFLAGIVKKQQTG
jgi:hypothetical protein